MLKINNAIPVDKLASVQQQIFKIEKLQFSLNKSQISLYMGILTKWERKKANHEDGNDYGDRLKDQKKAVMAVNTQFTSIKIIH